MNVDKFYELLWMFAAQRVVTVAARTGMLGRLAGRLATPDELAKGLSVDRLATGKVVRALCAMGVVEAEGERYRLTAGLASHFQPGEGNLTPFVEHAHALYDRWGEGLEEWVRTGRHARRRRSGEQLKRFSQAMRASAGLLAPQVVRALDGMQGIRRVLDLGGGTGGFARVFCRAREGLEVDVLDLSEVVELGRREMAGSDLAGRIRFTPGDFRESALGEGYDLVLLANVLHMEKPPGAASLVERAGGALAPGGHLAVVDFVIDDAQRENLMGALFAINMRSFGDTHTEACIRCWMQAAGVGDIRRVDLPPVHWLIVGKRS